MISDDAEAILLAMESRMVRLSCTSAFYAVTTLLLCLAFALQPPQSWPLALTMIALAALLACAHLRNITTALRLRHAIRTETARLDSLLRRPS